MVLFSIILGSLPYNIKLHEASLVVIRRYRNKTELNWINGKELVNSFLAYIK